MEKTKPVAAAGAVAAAAAATTTGVRARRRKRARQFRLHADEPAADGIRRVALAQLDLVTSHLEGTPGDEDVHEVRKALKRLRALLRLTRDELGGEVRRNENVAFREAGRRLADARDARVLLATFDRLVEPGTFPALRHELHAMATRVAARDRSEDIAAIRETAEAARGRVANWPLRDGMAPLASGLQRIHRRARRAHRVADADPTPENLHELRKRTKDLRYAAQVLGIRKLDKDADKLSDVLGLDHDVVQLLDVSHRYPHALTPTDRELFERLIETRRAELQREALGRARKLYATKPGKVARLVA